MIEVPWLLDRHVIVENRNDLSIFLQQHWGLEWLEYLTEHSNKIDIDKKYNPATMLYDVTFKFHLDPKKETFYRIKYGDGT